MVTVLATVEVKDGKMEEVIKVLKEIVQKVKSSEPGTLEYIPHTVKGVILKILSLSTKNTKMRTP